MFSAFENGDPMWVGEGPRLVTQSVRFSEPFRQPPVVQAAISMWDMAGSSNQRADLQATKITRDGFELEFRTWGDTQVARIRVSWLAIGAAPYADDWDVA